MCLVDPFRADRRDIGRPPPMGSRAGTRRPAQTLHDATASATAPWRAETILRREGATMGRFSRLIRARRRRSFGWARPVPPRRKAMEAGDDIPSTRRARESGVGRRAGVRHGACGSVRGVSQHAEVSGGGRPQRGAALPPPVGRQSRPGGRHAPRLWHLPGDDDHPEEPHDRRHAQYPLRSADPRRPTGRLGRDRCGGRDRHDPEPDHRERAGDTRWRDHQPRLPDPRPRCHPKQRWRRGLGRTGPPARTLWPC